LLFFALLLERFLAIHDRAGARDLVIDAAVDRDLLEGGPVAEVEGLLPKALLSLEAPIELALMVVGSTPLAALLVHLIGLEVGRHGRCRLRQLHAHAPALRLEEPLLFAPESSDGLTGALERVAAGLQRCAGAGEVARTAGAVGHVDGLLSLLEPSRLGAHAAFPLGDLRASAIDDDADLFGARRVALLPDRQEPLLLLKVALALGALSHDGNERASLSRRLLRALGELVVGGARVVSGARPLDDLGDEHRKH